MLFRSHSPNVEPIEINRRKRANFPKILEILFKYLVPAIKPSKPPPIKPIKLKADLRSPDFQPR